MRGSIFERFTAKYVVDLVTGCWVWVARIDDQGYGKLGVKARNAFAHRWAWEQVYGPVPEGLQLDHVCHSNAASCAGGPGCLHRRCVNPSHLEPVLPIENVRRSMTVRRVTCLNGGHPLDGLTHHGDGTVTRRCKTCDRDKQRKLARAKYASGLARRVVDGKAQWVRADEMPDRRVRHGRLIGVYAATKARRLERQEGAG